MKRRILNFNTFDEAIAEIQRLAAGGYEKTGRWSLGQVCEHLTLSMDGFMEGKTFPVPVIIKLIGPMIKKIVFRSRRMRSGAKTPAVLQPHDGFDESSEVTRAIAALRRFAEFPGPFPRNPIFGTLTLQEWRDLQLIHAAHHLGHLIPAEAVAA